MPFGALGDIHGDFESAGLIMTRHPEVPFWICTGDVADDRGNYWSPPVPLYWIKGNNDDFDAIAEFVTGACTLERLHYVPNGVRVTAGPIAFAGLGGTFSPTWYDSPAPALPYPRTTRARPLPRSRALQDKRRHFVRDEVEAGKRLKDVHVFLSHEAPRPFIVERPRPVASAGRKAAMDAGKTPINEVLAALRPKLHLFGHHHRFSEQTRQGVRCVGLDLISRSYLLIDSATFDYVRMET
jgi:uncharacterized protein